MRGFSRRDDGSAAVEFALVLPVLLLLVFGLIEFGMLLYTTTQLHSATESAARCSSVSQDCRVGGVAGGAVTNATVRTYANNVYKGLTPANFTYDTNGACSLTGAGSTNSGHRVSGRATFKFNVGVLFRSINVNSEACFP